MRDEAFRAWLAQKYVAGGAASRASEASRVEQRYGDLDSHFVRDGFERLLTHLPYSTADELAGLRNPTRIPIDGNIRNGLASLRPAIRCYRDFTIEKQRRMEA